MHVALVVLGAVLIGQAFGSARLSIGILVIALAVGHALVHCTASIILEITRDARDESDRES